MTGEAARPGPPPEQTAGPSPTGPSWAVLAVVLSAGALLIAGAGWFQLSREVDDLRGRQQSTEAQLLAMRPSEVIDLSGAPAQGSDNAIVTLVEFSDYECPFCIRHFHQTMPQIVANYVAPGKIRYAFRDWPVDQLHPQSIRAHEAAHCAGEQNKYWDIHPRLFSAPGTHTPDQLVGLARDAGLDMEAFSACVASGRSTAAIRETGRQAVELGAAGTPAFFLGVRDRTTNRVTVMTALSGAQPYELFARAIDGLLARQQ